MARPVLLMNPNSSEATTRAMVAIAARVLPRVEGWTAPAGPPLLTDPAVLAQAGDLVAAAEVPEGIAAVIVSAFGDPGQAALAARLAVPVVGIGGAAARAAARGGRRFAVVTHTPALVESIDALMRQAAPGRAGWAPFWPRAIPPVWGLIRRGWMPRCWPRSTMRQPPGQRWSSSAAAPWERRQSDSGTCRHARWFRPFMRQRRKC
ncbi:aspartate/glutamate racemase family protein [Salipiger marinus]|uniref:aspartate/glutamate racemase family protein n=1 Tax=Salipiger marinus TaxID=555512 RepID=UPI00363D2350